MKDLLYALIEEIFTSARWLQQTLFGGPLLSNADTHVNSLLYFYRRFFLPEDNPYLSFMEEEKLLSQTFRKDLEPIFEMLEQKEKTLSRDEWKTLVDGTRDRIIAAPEQYLSQGRVSPLLIARIVESIFEEGLN